MSKLSMPLFSSRRLRRTLGTALLFPICLSLAACQPTPDVPPVEPTPETEKLVIFQDGTCDFSIIRPDVCTTFITDAAVSVRDALQAANGDNTVILTTDYTDWGTSAPTDTKEILIGLTNRQESIDAHAALNETEYVIKVVNSRLVVVGYDDECTIAAVKKFLSLLPTLLTDGDSSQAKSLAIPVDYLYADTHVVKVWLDEFDKTSLSYYADQNLTYQETSLLGLDSFDSISYPNSFVVDTPDGEGIGFRCERDNDHWTLLSTPTDGFSLKVSDKFTQTVKLRVYINDTDLIACDHDAVYSTPQVGSQTLYITLSETKGGIGHTWQHTFYGSGWHDIELSFTCHNVAYPNLKKINYDNLTSLQVWCKAKAGLEVYFSDLRLCTYDNRNYETPEAPYNGRWLSTCDYDALDGPNLTEWYGSYFDLEEKVQGSSSLAITGHKENVDHRVCIGIQDVDVVYDEDTICFDLYLNDLALVGTRWEIRLEHNAQAAHYYLDYNTISSCVVSDNMTPTNLKAGWNHIQIPLTKTKVKIGAEYEGTFTNDLTLTQLVFYIEGTGSSDEQNYLIRYDNMYVAKTADLQAAKAALAGK